jgi:TIR domain
VRVFFCHASEDKAVVEQVFHRVAAEYPDVKGWLDRFEIVGGDDLIEKIAGGIDDADKFLVFVSERSIDKPWVRAELRKALMAEIEGIKPDFIVPIKLGQVTRFPPFIESKYYIDLEIKTEGEWLPEIYAAVNGVPGAAGPDIQDNLVVTAERVPDEPDALAIIFDARYWAEPVSFAVQTAAPIIERQYQLLPRRRAAHSASPLTRVSGDMPLPFPRNAFSRDSDLRCWSNSELTQTSTASSRLSVAGTVPELPRAASTSSAASSGQSYTERRARRSETCRGYGMGRWQIPPPITDVSSFEPSRPRTAPFPPLRMVEHARPLSPFRYFSPRRLHRRRRTPC